MADWKPDWSRVCKDPENHGWGHVWLAFGHQHDYWCKFCRYGVWNHDDRQKEFDFA